MKSILKLDYFYNFCLVVSIVLIIIIGFVVLVGIAMPFTYWLQEIISDWLGVP